MTPSLSTNRLILRPLAKATHRNLLWLRDPDVVKWSQQRHHEHSLSSQLRYVNSFTGKSHLWAIVLAENGKHIGNISARHEEPNNVSDVGIMIGETQCWGKGFATEAWKHICNWLLDKDCGDVRKISAGCARSNEAMLKIIRDSGFKQEGELLNQFLFDGAPTSALLFGRMR